MSVPPKPDIKMSKDDDRTKEDRLDALFNPNYKQATVTLLLQVMDRIASTDTFKHACERSKLDAVVAMFKKGDFAHILYAVMWMLKQDGEFYTLVKSGCHPPRFELFMRMLDVEMEKAVMRSIKPDGTLYYADMHAFVFQMTLSYAKRYDPYGEFEAHYGTQKAPPLVSAAASASASSSSSQPPPSSN